MPVITAAVKRRQKPGDRLPPIAHHCMITHYVEVPVSADISYDFRLLFVRLLIG